MNKKVSLILKSIFCLLLLVAGFLIGTKSVFAYTQAEWDKILEGLPQDLRAKVCDPKAQADEPGYNASCDQNLKCSAKDTKIVSCENGNVCLYDNSQTWLEPFAGCGPYNSNECTSGSTNCTNNNCVPLVQFYRGSYYYDASCKQGSVCVKGVENEITTSCQTPDQACGNGRGKIEDATGNPDNLSNFQFCSSPDKCLPKVDTLKVNGQDQDGFRFYYFDPSYKKVQINCLKNAFDQNNCWVEGEIDPIASSSTYKDVITAKNTYPVYDGCATEGIFKTITNFIGKGLLSLVNIILGGVVEVLGVVFGAILVVIFSILDWVLMVQNLDIATVGVLWLYIRDIANLGFIAILLYIAFATILRVQTANMRRLLPQFVLAVILVNFSKLIAFTVVDIAQFFINNLANMVTEAGGFNLMANIAHLANANTLSNVFGNGEALDDITVTAGLIFALITQFVLVVVFGLLTMLLLLRIVTIWILAVVSPLVYLAMAAGQKGLVRKWWDMFLSTTFFGPVVLFCLVAANVILSVPVSDILGNQDLSYNQALNSELVKSSPNMKFEVMAQMMFALAFVIFGLTQAKKASFAGASTVIGWANKGINAGKKYGMKYGLKKPAKYVGKQTVGRGLRATGASWIGRGLEKSEASALVGGKYAISERRARRVDKQAAEFAKIRDPRKRRAILKQRTSIRGPDAVDKRAAMMRVMAQEGELVDEDKKYLAQIDRAGLGGAVFEQIAKSKATWLVDQKDRQTSGFRSYVNERIRQKHGKDASGNWKVNPDDGGFFDDDRANLQMDWVFSRIKPSEAGNYLTPEAINGLFYDVVPGVPGVATMFNNQRAQAILSHLSSSHLSNLATNTPQSISSMQKAIESLHSKITGGINNMSGYGYDAGGNYVWQTSPNGARIKGYFSGVNAQNAGFSALP